MILSANIFFSNWQFSWWLAIPYLSNDQKQIILDVSKNLKSAEKVVKQFRELRPDTNTNSVIQL